jgi:hypothetical protein
MRNENISGVDIARMGDILSSLACWIDNPKTFPKKEEVLEIVSRVVKEQAIASADAPGKFLFFFVIFVFYLFLKLFFSPRPSSLVHPSSADAPGNFSFNNNNFLVFF